jgi:hypothetical protein
LRREVYSGRLRLNGAEDEETLRAALNYAASLHDLKRFEETKDYLREKVPVAQRVLGENQDLTLSMSAVYAMALYKDGGATLADLREAVTTLEDATRIARRVLGAEHPTTKGIEYTLREARAALRAREDAEPDISAQELDAAEAAPAAGHH